MKDKMNFNVRKNAGKLRLACSELLNEMALPSLENIKSAFDFETIRNIELRNKKQRDENDQNAKNQRLFFGWMKIFLYITSDYTIENLKSAYSIEKGEENCSQNVSGELKNKDQDDRNTLLFGIYSDLGKNGFNDIKISKYPMHRNVGTALIDEMSSRSASVYMGKNVGDNEEFKVFLDCCPQDSSSVEYQMRFFKTLLCYVIDQHLLYKERLEYRKFIKDINNKLGGKCRSFRVHFEICLRLIDDCIYDLLKYDISDRTILSELRKYRFNNDYFTPTLEQVRVYGQILALVLRLKYASETGEFEKQKGEEEGLKEEARKGEFEKEAYLWMNYELFYTYMTDMETPTREVIELGKRSLHIRDPKRRWRAFNYLGIYAIDNCQRQLAYDIYYSWLYGAAVGELRDCFPDGSVQERELIPVKIDEKWENASRARMHGHFAYVCGNIADTYELHTNEYKKYMKIAETEIKKAIDLNRMEGSYLCTYGTLLCEQAETETDCDKKRSLYKDAIKKYIEWYNAESEGGDFKTLESIFNILQEAFAVYAVDNEDVKTLMKSPDIGFDYPRILGNLRKDYFYDQLKKMIMEDYPDELDKEFNVEGWNGEYTPLYMTWRLEQYRKQWKGTVRFVDGDYIDNWLNDIECILLLLNEMVSDLKQNLRRRDYLTINYFTRNDRMDENVPLKRKGVSPIAYYTTLNTAMHIFKELQRKSDGSIKVLDEGKEGKNCLTAMNARYMNDPYEGLTLLKELRKNSGIKENSLFSNHSAEEIREEIFRDHYIFLKSFTNLNDSLVMWNRYASDFDSEGRSCNGCLISLDTDEFGGAVYNNETRNSLNRLEMNEAYDEYYLYRVVYISDGEILKERNPDIYDDTDPKLFNMVNREYQFLKLLIRMLDTSLENIPSTLDREEKKIFLREIRDYVQQSLRLIIFLFKNDEYADEKESRIVFSRRLDQQDTIRVLPGTPKKLCINPYFQIYINSIMFGPNVRDEENWIPYLQYQLNRMWSKNPAVGKDSGKKPQDKYKIEKSKIPYHT